MKRLFLPLCLVLGLSAWTGCTTLQHQTIEARLLQANQGVTIAINGVDGALNMHSISSSQAEPVSKVAHQLNPLLDAARAANQEGDAAGASKALDLIDALIRGLAVYAPPLGSK